MKSGVYRVTFLTLMLFVLGVSTACSDGSTPEGGSEGTAAASTGSSQGRCAELTARQSGIIWCDDFDDGVPIAQKYFEYGNPNGGFELEAGAGIGGSSAMRARWAAGVDFAGDLKRSFGRNPYQSQSHSNQDFREIYYRVYVKTAAGWSGDPYKLSRAMVMASSDWKQAMIAHVWGDGGGPTIMLDPASLVSGDTLLSTRYNDFGNIRWLGAKRGSTEVFSEDRAEQWQCIETRVKLNSPGESDGVFELFVNDQTEISISGLNWVGSWTEYGINAVFLENFWNGGAPGERIRYFDDFVISANRIGCD